VPRTTRVFFRNDDVHRPQPGLAEVTGIFRARGVPLVHAVEPANLAAETAVWLREQPPHVVEIVQHGFAHVVHDRGEFGGARPAEAQREDLAQGLGLMTEAFGDRFFRAMSFPFGLYNEHSPRILDELGYQVLTSHFRTERSRQVFYALGRMLGRGRWRDRHVSHHLRLYPGTQLREISVSISPIARYLGPEGGTDCRFHDQATLRAAFRRCQALTPVVGVVLHHRYHGTPDRLAVLEELLDWLLDQPDVAVTGIAAVHRDLAAQTASGGGAS